MTISNTYMGRPLPDLSLTPAQHAALLAKIEAKRLAKIAAAESRMRTRGAMAPRPHGPGEH